jgi:hypothetical protein
MLRFRNFDDAASVHVFKEQVGQTSDTWNCYIMLLALSGYGNIACGSPSPTRLAEQEVSVCKLCVKYTPTPYMHLLGSRAA